jgi:hypothetical protein
MGWGSGTGVMRGIIEAVRKHTPASRYRVALYRDLIRVLEDNDWDTQPECLGIDPWFDVALSHVHPDWAKDLPKPRYDEARSEAFQGEPKRLTAGGTFYAKDGTCSYHAAYYQAVEDEKAPVFLALRFGAESSVWPEQPPERITFYDTQIPLGHMFRWDTKEVFSQTEFNAKFKETPVAIPLRRVLSRHEAQPLYEHLVATAEHMTIALAESQDHLPTMNEGQEVSTLSPDEIMHILWGDPAILGEAVAQIDAASKAALEKRPTAEQRRASLKRPPET